MKIAAILSEIPLFHAVPPELLSVIAQDTHAHQVAKGTILFHQGTAVTGFYYVLCGSFKLSVCGPSGNEKIIEIIRSGMTFGEAVVFIQRPYPVTAEALGDATVLHIPSDSVLCMVRNNSEFALTMLAGLSHRLHMLIKDMGNLCLHSATQRVLGFLLTEAYNSPRRGNQFSFVLPANKKTIAAHLNLTPETFSRALRELSNKNLLSVKSQLVTIHDFEKLKRLEHCPE